jgi:hypothetical protein
MEQIEVQFEQVGLAIAEIDGLPSRRLIQFGHDDTSRDTLLNSRAPPLLQHDGRRPIAICHVNLPADVFMVVFCIPA